MLDFLTNIDETGHQVLRTAFEIIIESTLGCMSYLHIGSHICLLIRANNEGTLTEATSPTIVELASKLELAMRDT